MSVRSVEAYGLPTVGDMIGRLRRSGWTIADYTIRKAADSVFVVSGNHGDTVIRAEGDTRQLAWWRACEKARLLGMLDA
jgi:hypothetical protein